MSLGFANVDRAHGGSAGLGSATWSNRPELQAPRRPSGRAAARDGKPEEVELGPAIDVVFLKIRRRLVERGKDGR